MARRDLTDSRVILTGASSGIGRALARELARCHASFVLVARRAERLRELAKEIQASGARAEVVAGDVTDAAVRRAAVETAESAFGGLDLLINNAGVGATGPFAEGRPESLRQLMEVNFFAAVELTRLALPALQRGNRPLVVNISSMLGRRGIPSRSGYCASKFALVGFSESVRPELATLGIDLLLVNPGRTQSEFFDHQVETTAPPKWPAPQPMPAERVAHATLRAMRAGRSEIVPHFGGRMFLRLNRLAPRLVDRILRRFA